MGANSKIEWTDHTFNPWVGCTKISEGCKHCYAEALAKRTGLAVWGDHGERHATSNAYWKHPYAWAKKARMNEGPKPRVFCASLADVLEDKSELPLLRGNLWNVIRDTADALDWLLLTKRPENSGMIPADVMEQVWFGATMENQARANERMQVLVESKAQVRFVSAEPLLGPIDFEEFPMRTMDGGENPGIDWVIVGGESGPGARPMSEDWVRLIRNQCVSAGVPFFYKQRIDGGKKITLPELDGRQWAEFPEVKR